MDFCEQFDSVNHIIKTGNDTLMHTISLTETQTCTRVRDEASIFFQHSRAFDVRTFSSSQRLPMSPRFCGNLEGECRTVAKESSRLAL